MGPFKTQITYTMYSPWTPHNSRYLTLYSVPEGSAPEQRIQICNLLMSLNPETNYFTLQKNLASVKPLTKEQTNRWFIFFSLLYFTKQFSVLLQLSVFLRDHFQSDQIISYHHKYLLLPLLGMKEDISSSRRFVVTVLISTNEPWHTAAFITQRCVVCGSAEMM